MALSSSKSNSDLEFLGGEDVSDELKLEKPLNVYDLVEIDNIVPLLSEDVVRNISNQVYQGYKDDKNSRSSRETRMQQSMDLAMQIAKNKTDPFPGCANVILPLITTACIQFASRAYPAIIRDDAVAKVKVIGNDEGVMQPVIDPMTGMPAIDQSTGQIASQLVGEGRKKERGKRVADFQNWQLLEQSDNWEEDTDRLLHILPVTGNVYRKVYWSDGRFQSGIIFPKNFIVDYYTTDLNSARKTQEFILQEYEIKEKILSDLYVNFDIGSPSDDIKDVIPDTRQEGEGNEGADDSNKSAPFLFIEQHLRLDLDKDGYPEPYIATLHVVSEKLVRLEANYQRDGIRTKDDGKSKRIIKINAEIYFVKYPFIPSPDGSFYDLGFGDLLFNLNESINSIINRLLDAGTLASTSSGFVGRGVKIKGGILKINPGEFPVIDTIGGSIRDNFVQIQHPEPSATLFNLLGLLIEMAEKITQANQIVSGEDAGQMAGITMMQIVEQGLTGFKAIYKRIYRAIKKELSVLYRLNYLHLPDEVYARVLDMEGNVRSDFKGTDYDIVPISDPTMLTDSQRIARASFLTNFLQDPYMDGVAVREEIMDSVGHDKKLIRGEPPVQEDPNIALVKGQIEVETYKAQIKAKEAENKAIAQQREAQLDAAKAAFSAQMEAQKNEIKMQQEQFKLERLREENQIKAALAEVEIRKKNLEALETYLKIQMTQVDQASASCSQEKEVEVSEKPFLSKDAFDSIADAIRSLKEADKKRTVSVTRDPSGNLRGEIH